MFAVLYNSEVGGDDVVGEGGAGGARGVRRASDASGVKVGDAGTGASMSKIVTSLIDRAEFDDDVDELVSCGRRYG